MDSARHHRGVFSNVDGELQRPRVSAPRLLLVCLLGCGDPRSQDLDNRFLVDVEVGDIAVVTRQDEPVRVVRDHGLWGVLGDNRC